MSTIRPTLVTLAVFGALCVGASFVPAPNGDGALLDIAPQWPWQRNDAPTVAPTPDPVRAVVALPPAPAPSPEPTPQPEGSGEAAPQRAPEPDPADVALADAMRGLAAQLGPATVAIERPCLVAAPDGVCSRRALDHAFAELRDTALRQRTEPVRISQFGDSLVLGDDLCHGLRTRLQAQFGDGGHGFVYMGHPERIAGALGIHVRYRGAWDVATIVTGGGAGRYGLAGAAFTPLDAPSVQLRPVDEAGPGDAFDRVSVLWRRDSSGDTYRLTVDGETVPTARSAPGNVRDDYELPPGPHRLSLSGFRGGTWYGVVLENAGPGVVVDNLGMVNGSVTALSRIDEAHWAEHLSLRQVELGSFLFGVNRVLEHGMSDDRAATYTEEYADVLTRFRRARPDADCLVISVLTRAGWDDGRIVTWEGVAPMVQAQRLAAEQAGCAFWDAHAAIGGDDGAAAWYGARPQLLSPDLAHPTRQGYDALAGLIYDALIHAFVEYLDDQLATP